MSNPITVQLAQGIVRPSLSVMLGVKLFCRGVLVFENFTMCALDNFDVIPRNTFLDAYKIDILHNEGKLIVCANSGFKLMNLYVDYNYTLEEMGVNLVALVSKLKSPNFLVLMSLERRL